MILYRRLNTLTGISIRILLASLLLLVPAGIVLAEDGEDPGSEYLAEATRVGNEICFTCHDGFAAAEKQGIHSMLTCSGSRQCSCEDCHGPGSVHAETGDSAKICDPKRQAALVQLSCRQCHSKVHCGFKGHSVQSCGVHCTDCHRIHQAPARGTLVAPELELCTTCHLDIKAKNHLPSHHPMKDGRMACSSCHDITGSEPIVKERVNDTCLACHPQYRGPFVFEHAPVAEDCMICHDPHGSVANNMLKQNEPFLCLTCHQMHFHSQLEGYRGDFSAPFIPERGGMSNAESMKQAMLTKCTQCHQPVHGSDLPSQSLTGQGKGLTR